MNLRFFPIVTVLGVLTLCPLSGFGQVYSYLDQNGVRVLTNIPPNGQVADLKVTGALPQAVPAAVPVGKSARLPQSQSPALTRSATGTIAKPDPARNSVQPTAQKAAGRADYDSIVEAYASEFNLDPKLLMSMIATESGFNPAAVSPKGAQGLMQLMPETAARLGVKNPFDPEENIWGGARYMRFLLDTFADSREDNLILSLAAYNAGENLVQRLGRVPDFRETNEYVRSVLGRYGKRQMDVPPLGAPAVAVPTTYRYLDENGVLILTNIPPVDRSRNNNSGGTYLNIR